MRPIVIISKRASDVTYYFKLVRGDEHNRTVGGNFYGAAGPDLYSNARRERSRAFDQVLPGARLEADRRLFVADQFFSNGRWRARTLSVRRSRQGRGAAGAALERVWWSHARDQPRAPRRCSAGTRRGEGGRCNNTQARD